MNIANMLPISICVGISLALLILALFSAPGTKRERKRGETQDEWLYSRFTEKMYDAILGDKDPVAVVKKLGLEYDRYMLACNIINKTPDFKKEVMMRIAALAILGGCFFAMMLTFSVIWLFPGILAYYLLVTRVTSSAYAEAEARKTQMQMELPRFVDLLLPALEANLSIEVAILKTAEYMSGILTEELILSLSKLEIGADSWQSALEDVAHKYEVSSLTAFVSEVINAYKKGTRITEIVARQSYEIRQDALLKAKEKTSKLSTTVMIPILFYKLMPLMAIILIPILFQIFTLLT